METNDPDRNEPMTSGAGDASTGGAQGKFDKAKEYAQQKYSSASSTVRDKYTAVRQKVDDVEMDEVTEKVREYVRSNPGKALLFSVAAGFVIGLMFRHSDDE